MFRAAAIRLLTWLAVGLFGPLGLADDFTPEQRGYWALQPVRRPAVPQTSDAWCRNEIDAFILARLKEKGLSPAPVADRATLLRRACFDLTGLPPTPEEVEQFLADADPNAYERLIDRLLASPRYGERWGRHWLDLVRYAETDGYNQDATRDHAWRYRDYVIDALNRDTPYDRFIWEQLAGDELLGGTGETPVGGTGKMPVAPAERARLLAATGFLRHWPYEYNQRHVALQWETILSDVTDVTGQVFLGLTVQCARCHDHKYDPILQRDYFRLQALVAPILPRDEVLFPSPEDESSYLAQKVLWEDATADVRKQLAELEAPYGEKLRQERVATFPAEIRRLLQKAPEDRSPREIQLACLAERQFAFPIEELAKLIKGEEKKRWEALRKELAQHDGLKPAGPPTVMAVCDAASEPPPTIIPGEGDFSEPATHVAPGFLLILDARPLDESVGRTSVRPLSGVSRRSALAAWLTSRDNPLVARVLVNRLWQGHFRRGLVANPNDFGLQGGPCSHPQLLDWLADEFVSRGWSLKQMHRLMMTSAAYRQASTASHAPAVRAQAADPENLLLWRMRTGRLEAESVRDAMLAASGNLNLAMGGPSVLDALPEGISARHAWKPTASARERDRRSVYLFVKRNLLHPLLESLDMPDPHLSCARRQVTTTAPQALILINGPWSLAQAQSLAGRVLAQTGSFSEAAVRETYLAALGRGPTAAEIDQALDFVARQTEIIEQRGDGGPLALPRCERPLPELPPARAAAVVDYCHVLLNASEFLYVD
ncbi:MAG: DUF1553 domain-containing protein [Planctomycetia bacterium]|nr:DUF1553 domain-containing protein [Planctomycetia bacterium]